MFFYIYSLRNGFSSFTLILDWLRREDIIHVSIEPRAHAQGKV